MLPDLSRGGSRLQLDVAVHEPDLDVIPLAKRARDPVSDGDGPVPAAGAADGDRQVLLALGDVGGQQEVEQRHQAPVELAGLRTGLDVLADGLVETGQRPQIVDVVRIGQEADVEGEVGIERRTVLEAEGEDRERELVLAYIPSDQLESDPAPQ